ncbi:ribonuclease Z [Malassezia furfur]|uniref:ribonuclease Z n=1 Tax=Malassezia furfur TaxID=55194 RepID=A0ABY8ERL9_MALFU|nr:ribonuclease Z [Malassezia furfur]
MGASILRVLTAPSSDTSELPTLVLQCDATKYLFNAGEGTTRSSAQRRSSNARVEHVFVSRVASEAIGGIPGLLMTMADGGKTSVDVHGPPNTRYALATTRFYAKRDKMHVRVHDVPLDTDGARPCFEDEHIAVYAVPVVPGGIPRLPAPAPGRTPSYTPDDEPWRDPKWTPTALRGADADRWYSSVLEDAWGAKYAGDARAWTPSRIAHALPPPPVAPRDTGEEPGRQAPVLCYICAGATQRGKFDAQRAAALGLAPGPDFARLTRGEEVHIERPVAWATLSDAERTQWLRARAPRRAQKARPATEVPTYELERVTLRSSDVVGTARAGPVFFYVTLPTREYLDTFLAPHTQQAFAPYTQAANAARPPEQHTTPHVIVHAAPPAVLQDARYVAWMQSFGPACHHLVANRAQCADRLMYTSSALTLLRLARLDREMYSVPGYALAPRVACDGERVQPAAEDMVIGLQPRAAPKQLVPSAPVFDAPPATMDARLAEHATPEAADAWAQYEAAVARVHATPPVAGTSAADALTFTTLGTGSSAPSKYRNVLSTLVHIPGVGYVLLDAGEGTYFQLARRFGPGERGWDGVGIEHVLRHLRMVFVSHIHGDHHMGVARLLLERRKLGVERPLYFFSNNYTRFYLREYSAVEALGFDEPNGVIAVDNEHLDFRHGVDPEAPHAAAPASGARAAARKHLDAAKAALQLRAIRTAPVVHRTSHCYGLVLEHVDGWKLVFSGDTMPCAALVEAGQGATVLIHEATMQDDEAELAHAKGHSTIGQAVRIAQEMRAEHLLLTHFSQRYPKFARIDTGSSALPVGIAFDMMHITPHQMRQGKRQLPALQALFAAEVQDDGASESDASVAGAPEADTAPPPAKRSREEPQRPPAQAPSTDAAPADAPRHTVRHNDAASAWRYVVLRLAAAHAARDAGAHVPSEHAVRQGVAQAVQTMHGVIGAAFAVDVLYVGTPLGTHDAAQVADAVVRVPSEHVDALLSAVASIDPAARATLTDGQPLRVGVHGVSHNLAMLTSDARAWMAAQQAACP